MNTPLTNPEYKIWRGIDSDRWPESDQNANETFVSIIWNIVFKNISVRRIKRIKNYTCTYNFKIFCFRSYVRTLCVAGLKTIRISHISEAAKLTE